MAGEKKSGIDRMMEIFESRKKPRKRCLERQQRFQRLCKEHDRLFSPSVEIKEGGKIQQAFFDLSLEDKIYFSDMLGRLVEGWDTYDPEGVQKLLIELIPDFEN